MSAEDRMTKPTGPRPTDEELMLFADGELEGARRDEIAAHVSADPLARRKLSALSFAGELVRESALDAASAADGIADAVMARIAADPDAASDARGAKRETTSESVAATAKPASTEVASLEVARADRARRAEAGRSRRIFAVAAVAMAAAAAMLFWSRSAHRTDAVATQAPRETPAETAAPRPSDTPKVAAPAERGGAEVAAVDFGARTGSIFYVPSDAASRMTAVVWIDDDTAGGL